MGSRVVAAARGERVGVAVHDAIVDVMDSQIDLEDLHSSGFRRLLRAEYDHLVDLGTFDGEKVELLRGMLVTMSPEGYAHAEVGNWLFRRLVRAFGDDQFELRYASPYAANEDSEPEPDIFVGRPEPGRRAHPSSAVLLVEVSSSSLRKDRRIKQRLYAEVGVPEYWIIDVSGSAPVVEVYTKPTRVGYAKMTKHVDGDVLRPPHVPIEIAVSDLPR